MCSTTSRCSITRSVATPTTTGDRRSSSSGDTSTRSRVSKKVGSIQVKTEELARHMKLQSIRLFSFQSFGPEPTELTLNDITYLIGPNGSGKTAALQALCRLFAFDPSLRRIRRSDFHVPYNEEEIPEERQLWIEAD